MPQQCRERRAERQAGSAPARDARLPRSAPGAAGVRAKRAMPLFCDEQQLMRDARHASDCRCAMVALFLPRRRRRCGYAAAAKSAAFTLASPIY